MLHRLKTSFAWPFAGGFLAGALALVALQPASGTERLVQHLHHAATVVR